MRVGSLHYATHSGLGILAREFYSQGVITDVLIKYHGVFETHRDWYPGAKVVGNAEETTVAEDLVALEDFIKNLDVLFVFESPWYQETAVFAQKHGVPIVCMPSYEWSPYPLQASVFTTTSLLDYSYYKTMYPEHRVVMLPVPANSNVQWKLRERATIFMHNGGNGSRNDRNGTVSLIEALPYIKSPIKLKLRGQNLALPEFDDSRVELVNNDLPFSELWNEADAFVFVERFAGLSLPLQEAFSAGLLVIAGDRYPINQWLPSAPLVAPTGYEDLNFVGVPFKSALYDPKTIASKIDEFYDTDISGYSLAGKKWAEENSWEALRPQYIEMFKSLL